MKEERTYSVYILASRNYGTLYIGVTGNLLVRVQQHRDGAADGFTKRYGVKRLVFYEHFGAVEAAIKREKQLKHWKRDWKISLIERDNPHWEDLYPRFTSPIRVPVKPIQVG